MPAELVPLLLSSKLVTPSGRLLPAVAVINDVSSRIAGHSLVFDDRCALRHLRVDFYFVLGKSSDSCLALSWSSLCFSCCFTLSY